MRKIAFSAVAALVLLTVVATHPAAAETTHPPLLNAITAKDIVTAKAVKHITTKPAKIALAQVAPTPAPVVVTIQPGDTLNSVAAANNTTYDRIFDANDSLTDPNVIIPGQQLRIPADNEQLPARALPAAAVASAPQTRTASVASAPVSFAGGGAKAFIYSRESGNNPNSTSASGCYGLGQDCNGVVRNQCGADYACQDAYFTNYAVNRYGSWEGAATFWQANGWW